MLTPGMKCSLAGNLQKQTTAHSYHKCAIDHQLQVVVDRFWNVYFMVARDAAMMVLKMRAPVAVVMLVGVPSVQIE